MNKNGLNALAVITLLGGVVPAQAAALYCAGTVSMVTTRDNGALLIRSSYRGDQTQLCSLQNAWKGIAVEQCKAWHAVLISAQITSGTVQIYYANPEGYASCATIPLYADSPAPGALSLGTDM